MSASCTVKTPVADGTLTLSAEARYDFTKTDTKTKTVTKVYTQILKVAPNTKAVAECSVFESKLSVPYTIYVTSRSRGPLDEILNGIWHGQTVSTVHCKYHEYPL